MDENYRLIEQETQEYYLEFLQKWKDVAKSKISQYRSNIDDLKKEKDILTHSFQEERNNYESKIYEL